MAPPILPLGKNPKCPKADKSKLRVFKQVHAFSAALFWRGFPLESVSKKRIALPVLKILTPSPE